MPSIIDFTNRFPCKGQLKQTIFKSSSLVKNLVILVLAVGGLLVWLCASQGATLRPLPNPPLKDLASRHHLELGNFAILSRINEPQYNQILTSQFNLALADNTPNWYFTDGGLRPSATTYNFKQMDQVVQYASAQNMTIQAHHLLWGEEKWLPTWLKNTSYNRSQLLEIMQQHILAVV